MLRAIIAVVLVGYIVVGIRSFGVDLYTSPRFVRQPPRTGFWGPIRFLSRDTWTEEGWRRRNRLLLWQIGAAVLTVLAVVLW